MDQSNSSAQNSISIPQMLKGHRVLICRPEPGASELFEALTAMGADCLKLPMLQTHELPLSPTEKQAFIDLDQYQHIIVVSQHAAKIAIELVDTYWPQLPVKQTWHPIGRKTASILQDYGIDCLTPDSDLTSEALLNKPALKKLREENILLLKGKGGRDLIRQKLEKAAKRFDIVELYKRDRPDYTPEEVKSTFETLKPDYVIALSGETLTNLIKLSQDAGIDLSQKSFILSSKRVANIAYEAGIKKVFLPENLMPIDIIKCIAKASKHSS